MRSIVETRVSLRHGPGNGQGNPQLYTPQRGLLAAMARGGALRTSDVPIV